MKVEDISVEMEKVICDMYDRKCAVTTIANSAGLPYELVRQLLVSKYGKLRKTCYHENLRRDMIAMDWQNGTRSLRALADKYECSERAVRQSLYLKGISSKRDRDDVAIVKAYLDGEPLKKIAEDFDISYTTVYNIVGKDRRGQRKANHSPNKKLEEAIKNADKSVRGWQTRVAEEQGVSRQRVSQVWKLIEEEQPNGKN